MTTATPSALHDALQRHFGFPRFRPGQGEALGHVLAGRDLLVVMPTGSGKSLIYQLAALLRPGMTLVISPLVALMKDQADGLTRRGIPATYINSGLDPAEQSRRLRALADGRHPIVLVAPERLRSRAFRESLARVPLGLFVVDEAHCLSQWGHDFRPDYLHLAEARREFNAPVTLALTATATPRVQDDILRLLDLPAAARLITGFNRPNLTFEVFSTPGPRDKLNLLRDFLPEAGGAGIVYTGTRRDAEEVAEFVREVCRLDARHYHGALDPAERARTQDAFMAGDLPIVVATNAFGMGIDRADVRFVLHHSLPGTLEAYYQEAGRAGRDGLPARAVLCYSPKDTALQEFFIENDSPNATELRAAHDFVKATASAGFTLDDLERATGLPQIKARVALEQLQAARALRRAPDEAYGLVRAEALPLSDPALRAIAAQVEARRRHKRAMLDTMVDYAETNDCRRRSILRHFGDAGEADAPLCCDNCLAVSGPAGSEAEARTAQTQSERAALIVLDAIAKLPWDVGKGKLAQILKGSKAQDVARYSRAAHFGKFAALRLSEIESLIGQLIDTGYIKQVGSQLPTLKLTPKGANALQARAAIRVDLRAVKPGAAQQLRAQREAGGTVGLTGQMLAGGLAPEQIAAERGLTAATIYSHLAQLIAEGKADVDAVVPAGVQAQIRAAIEQAGSAAYLAPIKALLPEAIDYGVIRCVVEAWRKEHNLPTSQPPNHPTTEPPLDPVSAFLSRPHPRPLAGPWLAGWALDFHSQFSGADHSRSEVGELAFLYKYRGERHLARDLAGRWAELLAAHPELPKPDAVVPVPPSQTREFDPVTELARALASRLSVPALAATLVKTRATKPQKELTALAQKQANVRGAFAVNGDVRDKRLILVDDLYDSGATLAEAARVLARAGAAGLVVLTLTKTIHADK